MVSDSFVCLTIESHIPSTTHRHFRPFSIPKQRYTCFVTFVKNHLKRRHNCSIWHIDMNKWLNLLSRCTFNSSFCIFDFLWFWLATLQTGKRKTEPRIITYTQCVYTSLHTHIYIMYSSKGLLGYDIRPMINNIAMLRQQHNEPKTIIKIRQQQQQLHGCMHKYTHRPTNTDTQTPTCSPLQTVIPRCFSLALAVSLSLSNTYL